MTPKIDYYKYTYNNRINTFEGAIKELARRLKNAKLDLARDPHTVNPNPEMHQRQIDSIRDRIRQLVDEYTNVD